jgi:hypothetical protein
MIRRFASTGFAKTGAVQEGYPVQSRDWHEVVDELDTRLEALTESEEEEAIVDLWLEDPRSFMEGEINPSHMHTGSMVRRLQTGGMGLQRHSDVQHKTASASNWDQEFADAKAHAASVLSKLGNGR